MSTIPTYHGFLLGIRARGSVGKEKTFRVRGGVQEQYPFTVGADPKSELQQAHRGVFRLARFAWNALAGEARAGWDERAKMKGRVMGVNLFMGAYVVEYWGGP